MKLIFIGKTNKQTTNFHPSPRSGVRYRCFITKSQNHMGWECVISVN